MAYVQPKLNDYTLPWANSWEESSEVIENTMVSEAGTDLTNVVRYDKLTITASYRCMSDVAQKLKELSKANTLILTRYDIEQEVVEERTMRMREFTANLIKDSHKVGISNGLWEVSFTLIEF